MPYAEPRDSFARNLRGVVMFAISQYKHWTNAYENPSMREDDWDSGYAHGRRMMAASIVNHILGGDITQTTGVEEAEEAVKNLK